MAEDIEEEWGDTGDPYDPEYIAGRERAPRKKVEDVKGNILQQIATRQRAYRLVFGNADPDALALVMADLDKFCRGNRSTFDPDERIHCLITGRQEVYARIQQHLQLTLDNLIVELS